jgi:hypothetical protein
MSEVDVSTLFSMAIEVWDRAIRRHQSKFPYREILPRCEKALRGRNLLVQVYDNNPDRPVAHFQVRLENGLIRPVGEEQYEGEKASWRVSKEYLQDVAHNADHYVEHPAKLDWDWLTRPIGASI